MKVAQDVEEVKRSKPSDVSQLLHEAYGQMLFPTNSWGSFSFGKMRSPLSSLPRRSWDEDKTVHGAQPHLSHTIIFVFWFGLNFKGDQLISSLTEMREEHKRTPANMGYASCRGLLLVKNKMLLGVNNGKSLQKSLKLSLLAHAVTISTGTAILTEL